MYLLGNIVALKLHFISTTMMNVIAQFYDTFINTTLSHCSLTAFHHHFIETANYVIFIKENPGADNLFYQFHLQKMAILIPNIPSLTSYRVVCYLVSQPAFALSLCENIFAVTV